MILAYKNSEGKLQDIADVQSEEQAIKEIQNFCNSMNYNIPYISVAYHTNVIIYDVGIYTQFFYLYLRNNED